jgi:hypothetical protein
MTSLHPLTMLASLAGVLVSTMLTGPVPLDLVCAGCKASYGSSIPAPLHMSISYSGTYISGVCVQELPCGPTHTACSFSGQWVIILGDAYPNTISWKDSSNNWVNFTPPGTRFIAVDSRQSSVNCGSIGTITIYTGSNGSGGALLDLQTKCTACYAAE